MARETLLAQLHLIDPVWEVCVSIPRTAIGIIFTSKRSCDAGRKSSNVRRSLCALARPELFADGKKNSGLSSELLTSPEGAFYAAKMPICSGKHSAEYFR